MKMRKIFAILLSTALLMALAIVPTSAAYRTPAASDVNEAVPSGGEKTFEVDGNYAEVNFTLTEGKISVCFGNTLTVDTLNVTFEYVSDTEVNYHIRGKSSQTIQNNLTTDSNVITVSAMVVGTDVIVNVNGAEKVIALSTGAIAGTPIDTGFVGVKVLGKSRIDDTPGTATINTFAQGTALASIEDGTTDVEIGVKPTITPDEYLEVTIVAGEFNFVYTPETYRWDADANEYVIDVPSSWAGNDGANNIITVTNLSSVAVDVEVTSTVLANTDGVTFALDKTEETLAAASVDSEPSVVITGTIGGVPGTSYEASEDGTVLTNIGTITVSVFRAAI